MLFRSHTHSLSFSLSLSLFFKRTYSLFHLLSFSHTHSPSFSLSLSLYLFLSLSHLLSHSHSLSLCRFTGVFGGFEADPLVCWTFQGAHLAIPTFITVLCCTSVYILLPPKSARNGEILSHFSFAYLKSFFPQEKSSISLLRKNSRDLGSADSTAGKLIFFLFLCNVSFTKFIII